jgi:tRNA-splicing ligase RtcB
METNFNVIENEGGAPVKAWTRGVSVEPKALEQLRRTASLPIIHGWVAAMPDVHVGIGATVGSVVPTLGAVIPAAVGVDIGCGMSAVCTTLKAEDLPTSLKGFRTAIEMRVPVGRGMHHKSAPDRDAVWARLGPRYWKLVEARGTLSSKDPAAQLGTLGTG